MDLFDALPAKPRRDPIVAQWYRTIGAYLARDAPFRRCLRHFERARKTVPDDPGCSLARPACRRPSGARPIRISSASRRCQTVSCSSASRRRQTHFRRAESLLTRALAAQPDFVDARLRLGRALAQQRNRPQEALPHLTRVVADSPQSGVDRSTRILFAGEAALALDRLADARASYERALAAFTGRAIRPAWPCYGTARGRRSRSWLCSAVMTTLTIEPQTRDTSRRSVVGVLRRRCHECGRTAAASLRAPFRNIKR